MIRKRNSLLHSLKDIIQSDGKLLSIFQRIMVTVLFLTVQFEIPFIITEIDKHFIY